MTNSTDDASDRSVDLEAAELETAELQAVEPQATEPQATESLSANRLIVVWVTTPSENSAKAIAAALVEQRLAACATITPAYSVYRWQGAVEHAQEWQLSIKTHRERLTALQALVHRLHSYDVPEILALPILGGSPRYLSWLAAQVT